MAEHEDFWGSFRPKSSKSLDAGIVKIDLWIDDIKEGKFLTLEDTLTLCEKAREILIELPNLIPVPTPVSVCGDIHGQIEDLLELFRIGLEPPATTYIFMGDYVDRGHHGILVACLLLCYKVRYPDSITLLRGNHESRAISQVYGFYDECNLKYGDDRAWKSFMSVFDLFPVAALVDSEILCVHGGLSPKLKTLDQIRDIIRDQEINYGTIFSDMLWSDPEYLPIGIDWEISSRGVGWLFGQSPVDNFQELNAVDLIVRGHQLVQQGFQYLFSDRLITVWSAPNYVYKCGNKAAIFEIDQGHNENLKVFDAVPDSLRFTVPNKVLAPKYFL